MNLHGIAGPIVAAVNPFTPVEVRISAGPSDEAPDGSRTPMYATPGGLTGSIADTTLTVTAVPSGKLLGGQLLAGADVLLLTRIVRQLDGDPGGVGNYEVNRAQTVAEEDMTTSYPLRGQIQPVTWRDLQQLDGLNLGGIRWKAYLAGQVDAVVRPDSKGGDLVLIASGRHQGTWLVAQVLEQFPDWCCAAMVLQNAAAPDASLFGQLDFSNPDQSALQAAIMTGV